jgi:hypothetical protein
VLGALLERCEARIRTFAQDVLDGWLGMAQEFNRAHERLTNQAQLRVNAPTWSAWVARFNGIVSLATANNLARIGALEADELQTLRSTIFAKSGGISGIAAYIAARIALISAALSTSSIALPHSPLYRVVRPLEQRVAFSQRLQSQQQTGAVNDARLLVGRARLVALPVQDTEEIARAAVAVVGVGHRPHDLAVGVQRSEQTRDIRDGAVQVGAAIVGDER